MDESFDVVLFGAHDGQDPSVVARRIASAFNLPPQQAQQLLLASGGGLFRSSVSADDAERYQKVLSQMGAKVNYKPSMGSVGSLRLVPKEKPKYVCPGCGHLMRYDEGASPPEACPQCGLVFEKYREIQRQKEEADAIRDRLKKINSMREEQETQQLQQEDEARRKRLLEEQIRRELGLPAMVDRPWKLWSSAAATLILGVGIGTLGGLFLFSSPGKLQMTEGGTSPRSGIPLESLAANLSTPLEGAADQMGAGRSAGTASLEQEIQSEEQLLRLSHKVMDLTDISATAGAGAGASEQAAQPGRPQTSPERRPDDRDLVAQFLTASDEDLEWQWLIEREIPSSLAAGAITKAARLADHLTDPLAQQRARARIAGAQARAGRTADAERIVAALVESVSAEPSAAQRVEILAAAAPILAQAEMRSTATHLLSQASETAPAVSPVGAQASAWAAIAMAQAESGLLSDAQASILAASRALEQRTTAADRVEATARLAEVFARLGAKERAAQILEKAETAAGTLQDFSAKDAALGRISSAWASVGDLRHAMRTTTKLSSAKARDRQLLSLLEEQAFEGESFGLGSLAEGISLAAERSIAFATLGAASSDRNLGQRSFQQAAEASAGIADALERTAIQGKIARLMARGGQRQMASQLFAQIEKDVLLLPSAPQKDIGWARLAKNRARALEPSQAEPYLTQIKNQQIQEAMRTDLLRVSRIVRFLSEPAQAPST